MDNVAALPELVSRPDPVQQDDTVLVSIVMPAFNAEAYIGAAIASAQAQSEARVEILVIDDGSTDRTLPLLRGIASDEPRVEIARAPERASAVYA